MDDQQGQMQDAQLAALFQKLQQNQEMAPLEMAQSQAHTGMLQEQTRKLRNDEEQSPENNALRSADYLSRALSQAYTPQNQAMLIKFLQDKGLDLPMPQAPVDPQREAIKNKLLQTK